MTRAAVLASVVVAFSGCVNLDAVRKFAKTSAATADYGEVVADYVSSPERQRRYEPERLRAELDAVIKERKAQQPRLLAAQKALTAYLSALGELAADSLPDAGDPVDAMAKALDTAKFIGKGDQQINKETASAASALTKLVVRAVLDRWRQAELASMLRQSDEHVQAVIEGLKEVLDKDLRESLKVEAEAAKKPFLAWKAAATGANDPDGAPAVARLLLEERAEVIADKQARIDEYLKILTAIGKGHRELVANAHQLDFADLKAKLDAYNKDIKNAYIALDALNSKK